MSQVTIDGRALEFRPGESVIELATRSGIEIPYYCWHPRLSVAANCRMCLVEIEGSPKLAPACQSPCRDGMVVHTANPRVAEAQRAVHEFLLINHPIDCPICDQAGECKLQDYYMKYQLAPSRMDLPKVPKRRLEVLGPYVVYNAERCIMCTRCVRFMEEVAHDRQLGVLERGDHCEIGVMPGQQLDSAYSLNTADVCPVGALTSRVFRFKQRVWNLRRSNGVCGGCARGCNVYVEQRAGLVYRLLPRDNDHVNASWMCDEGRLTYDRANEGRLRHARARRPGGSLEEAEEAEEVVASTALRHAAELLAGAGRVAVLCSLHATLEEAYVLGRLARELLNVSRVGLIGYAEGPGDQVLRVPDRNPNRRGIEVLLARMGIETAPGEPATLDSAEAVLVVGHQCSDPRSLAATLRRARALVHVAHAEGPLAEAADVTLPAVSWVQLDGTWVNVDGRAQALVPAFPPEGDARPADRWLVALAERLGAAWTLPSSATIRAEIAREVPAFEGILDPGPTGVALELSR